MSHAPSAETPRDFAVRCLSECEQLTATLKSALQLERTALEQRDHDGLDRALETKRDCIARLQEADPRRRLGPRAGAGSATADPVTLEAHLASLDDEGALAATWRGLLTLTRECQTLNDRNGMLTTRLRNRAEQTLLLIQAAAGQETPTPVYGPDGAVSSPITRLPKAR